MRFTLSVLITTLVILAPAIGNAAEVIIKFSHVVAENTPKGQAALHFKQVLEQRLAGQARVEIYPNALLMNDEEVIASLLQNNVQMAAPSLSLLEPYSKAFQVFDLPFLFADAAALQRFRDGPAGRDLLGALGSSGIEGLCFMHNGMKQLSANKPLRRPEDARGLKFRIQPSSVLVAQFEAIGAIPVKAPFTKVFHLLQTGTVDGQENTWSNIYSQNFYRVQSYITETNQGTLDYLFMTSRAFLDGLAPDIRQAVVAAARDACDHGNAVAAELNAADKEKIRASGYTQVITLTADERRRWVEAMQPVWARFAPEVGSAVIAAAQAANTAN